jgi:DNA-binding transcriptional ArsR family regulator
MRADFSSVAKLLANPARSAMIGALLEGRALTAGELARLAGVAPSTASEHLDELVSGGLLAVRAQGRHRYFSLAGPSVAEALESFSLICPEMPVKTLCSSEDARALRFARTCYDHLAGVVGVALLDTFQDLDWLAAADSGLAIGPRGEIGFATLGVDVHAVRSLRRPFIRPCVDWTERRIHLAGALGAAVAESMTGQGWIEPCGRRRAVRVTTRGASRLTDLLGIDVSRLATESRSAPELNAVTRTS